MLKGHDKMARLHGKLRRGGQSLLACVLLAAAIAAHANGLSGGQYAISPLDVNCGSSRATGGVYLIESSTAQFGGVGPTTAASYAVANGFWSAAVSMPTTVTLTSLSPEPTKTSPIHVTVVFSDDVTSFTADDLATTNATVANFTGSAADYEFDLVPAGQGLVSVVVPVNAGYNANGFGNTASGVLSRHYDTQAPVFAGLVSVSPGDGFAELSWNAASDPSTPVTYNIYVAESSGGENYAVPGFSTQDTSFTVGSLLNNHRYYFVVRAEDALGTEDTNTVEKSVLPQSRKFQPVFEGVFQGARLPGWFSGGAAYSHPVPVDLDDDGDLDMIVGEADGTLTYWENVGTRRAPEWGAPEHGYAGIDVGSYAAPSFGDIDADGDPDLVVGESLGTLVFYRNVGTAKAPGWALPEAGFAGLDVLNSSVPTLGDLDGDGDPDLVVGQLFDGALSFVENLGGGSWGPQIDGFAGATVGAYSSPFLVDWDGDADLDLVVGSSDGTLSYLQNTGTSSAAVFDTPQQDNWQSITVGAFAAPALADVNGDEQLDVFLGNQLGEVSGYLAGLGGTLSATSNFEFLDIGDYSAPALGDLDGDGDLDMLLGQKNGTLAYSENSGNVQMGRWKVPDLNYRGIDAGNYSIPAIGDLDADGRLDLVIGELNGRLGYYRNTGTTTSPLFSLVTSNLAGLDVGYNSAPCLVDINADGDLDIVVGAANGRLTLLPNTGTPSSPAWGTPVTDFAGIAVDSYSRPAFGTVEPSGLLTLVVGSNDGTLVGSDNIGTKWSPVWGPPRTLYGGIDVGYRATPDLADLDGDGDPDLVCGEKEGGLNLWRNMLYHLELKPQSITLLLGGSQVFQVQNPRTSATLEWSFSLNQSGGSLEVLDAVSARYTAGPTGGANVHDIIEARETSAQDAFFARGFVNVLNPSDTINVGKAIVCAGRKDATDSVWPASNYLAQLAYKNLRIRGFRPEDIYYLSPDTSIDADGDGSVDVDAEATLANLEHAVTVWAAGTEDLTVFLVDHGWEENGQGRFRVNSGDSNVLTAEQLDEWLDDLQSSTPMKQRVVIDCCNSGAFLETLAPLAGRERYTVTSCADNQVTYFVAGGLVSFSECFWNTIFSGGSFGQAFVQARDAMDRYQSARADSDGNGVYVADVDSGPASATWTEHIGLPGVAGADRPYIGTPMSNQSLGAGETSLQLWARDVSGTFAVDRVWAVIVPPDFQVDPESTDPVLDLPQIEFDFDVQEDRWEALCTTFTQHGSYKIILYASDTWGAVSMPKQVYVHKTDLDQRAIILVGGTPYDASTPVQASYRIGALAAQTLRKRGFSDNQIYYLSSQTGVPEIDASPTLANFENAIGSWAGSVGQLTIIAAGGSAVDTFQLNDSESISAVQLDTLLDDYQTVHAGRVVLSLDCPDAGSFLDDLTPPTGRQRIILTSGRQGALSYCFAGGLLSFSHCLLSKIFEGVNLNQAFVDSRSAVRFWTGQVQVPGLDDDGDGISGKQDGTLAAQVFVGAPFLTGGDDLPVVGAHNPDTTMTLDQPAVLWASGVFDSDGIAEVRAFVVPQTPLDPAGIVDLPMTFNAADSRWEANHTFTQPGQYAVCFFARDNEDNESPPSQVMFYVLPQAGVPDSFEPDNLKEEASLYLLAGGQLPDLQTTQSHNFHAWGDADWIRFSGLGGHPYGLAIKDALSQCDAVVELYDSTGTLPIGGPWDDTGAGQEESVNWNCPADGVYYWRVYNADPTVYGAQTSYTLELDEKSGANNGLATVLGPQAVRVSWSGTLGAQDAGFVVSRMALAQPQWVNATPAPIEETEWTDSGLTPLTNYYYVVYIRRVDGTEIQLTPILFAQTPIPVRMSLWTLE